LKDLLLHSILILNLNVFSVLLMSIPMMSGASGRWVGFKENPPDFLNTVDLQGLMGVRRKETM
jgi:hypothetical protein